VRGIEKTGKLGKELSGNLRRPLLLTQNSEAHIRKEKLGPKVATIDQSRVYPSTLHFLERGENGIGKKVIGENNKKRKKRKIWEKAQTGIRE